MLTIQVSASFVSPQRGETHSRRRPPSTNRADGQQLGSRPKLGFSEGKFGRLTRRHVTLAGRVTAGAGNQPCLSPCSGGLLPITLNKYSLKVRTVPASDKNFIGKLVLSVLRLNCSHLIMIVLGLLVFCGALHANEQAVKSDTNAVLQAVDQKLSLLEIKISHLNKTQAQIVQKNQEITKELDELGIWIRRNRG